MERLKGEDIVDLIPESIWLENRSRDILRDRVEMSLVCDNKRFEKLVRQAQWEKPTFSLLRKQGSGKK